MSGALAMIIVWVTEEGDPELHQIYCPDGIDPKMDVVRLDDNLEECPDIEYGNALQIKREVAVSPFGRMFIMERAIAKGRVHFNETSAPGVSTVDLIESGLK